MQLRADLGARRAFSVDHGSEKYVDYVAGLGIQYSWGGSPTRKTLDGDNDGVIDDDDKCPGTPAGTAVDSSGCPLPQDDDGDGVNNDIDKCPERQPVPKSTRMAASSTAMAMALAMAATSARIRLPGEGR
jgi:hypothetical protein